MSGRGWYLLGMLIVLFLANVAMLMGLNRPREGFANAFLGTGKGSAAELLHEGFTDALVNGFATAPIGSYDGLDLAKGLPPDAQGFRANHPNDPLNGPAIQLDADHLFLYANNRASPECCSSTLTSDMGCVCLTLEQRNQINTRGGNRLHDSEF